MLANNRDPSIKMSRRDALTFAGGSLLAALCPSGASALETPGRPAIPSHGFNLPGWLDHNDGVAPSQAVLEKLRQLGFETIRLPVNGDLISADNTATLQRVQEGISLLVRLGFAVIVDLHPSADLHAAFQNDPASGVQRAVQAWTVLRDVVADLPPSLVYPELLNEPPMDRVAWLALREQLAETVRSKCPLHTLVWGPAPFQGIWELADTPPLADDNQIAALHFYAPTAFTHQCETWNASPLARIANLPFPATAGMPPIREQVTRLRAGGDEEAASLIESQLATPWTEAAIASEFATLKHWSVAQNCPVTVNEFGVLNFCTDAESRTSWVRAVRKAADTNEISWAYWELDQGFGFIRNRQSTEGFDTAMITALLGEP
jgi:endoglucanase